MASVEQLARGTLSKGTVLDNSICYKCFHALFSAYIAENNLIVLETQSLLYPWKWPILKNQNYSNFRLNISAYLTLLCNLLYIQGQSLKVFMLKSSRYAGKLSRSDGVCAKSEKRTKMGCTLFPYEKKVKRRWEESPPTSSLASC